MNEPARYAFRDRDAAHRMADTIALHQAILSRDELMAGRYVAIRLADGGSDGTAYPSLAAAAEHQRHDVSRHGYYRIPVPPEHLGPKACDVLLWYVRTAYDNGVRQDPAHQLMIPIRTEDLLP